jgi:hypothetical protein
MIREKLKRLLFRHVFPISQAPPMPSGHNAESLFEFLSGFNIDGSESGEIKGYLAEDFLRFVHTLNLIPTGEGKLLEIGSNPYFT